MNDLFGVAVLLLLIVGLGLAAADNAGVRLQFPDDVRTPSHSLAPDSQSHAGSDHSDLPEHGHIHRHSGD